MKASTLVAERIKRYDTRGNLQHTASVIMALCSVKHGQVKGHMERVGLLCEGVAKKLKKDQKAAFFAGLLHDIGKIILPYPLFDGHDITTQEYAEVKEHAIAGFRAVKNIHLFVALCAGVHHALYSAGYGLTIDDFPKKWSLSTVKKVLEISAIVSICDFIDAYTFRKTRILDGSDKGVNDLAQMLKKKYPNDELVVDTALEESQKLFSRLSA